MSKIIYSLFIAVIALSLTSTATATVVTFEDSAPYMHAPIENGYGGLSWENMYSFDPVAYGYSSAYGEGYVNGVVSGGNVAFNGYGDIAVTSNDTPFDFNGAWFTSAWFNNNILSIYGFRENALIYTTTAILNTNGPIWVAANFLDVDLVLLSTNMAQFVMDDFTYNETAAPEPAATPEPSTILLVATGIAALVMLRRKATP